MFKKGDRVWLRDGISDAQFAAIFIRKPSVIKQLRTAGVGVVDTVNPQGRTANVDFGVGPIYYFASWMLATEEQLRAEAEKAHAQISADHSEYYSAITEVDHEPV